jgi:hypothetical protein
MSFKLKRKGEILGINEELSSYSHPVFEKNLGPNVIAEANRDGTTFVNKNASMAQKRDARVYKRMNGHLMNMNSPADKQLEGSPALEWEAEANKLS